MVIPTETERGVDIVNGGERFGLQMGEKGFATNSEIMEV